MIQPRSWHAGIDSDIKLWAPTAAEPRDPGRQAERVMAENRQQQVLPRLMFLALGDQCCQYSARWQKML